MPAYGEAGDWVSSTPISISLERERQQPEERVVRAASLQTLQTTVPPAEHETGEGSGDGDSQILTSAQGEEYSYRDGPYVRTIVVQTDLVVVKRDDDLQSSSLKRRDAVLGATVESDLVFRSASGQVMTLPGGVLIKFDDSWTAAQASQFFSEHSIAPDRYEAQTYSTNAYFITTEPGFPSLNLANRLATQDGVVYSLPNWAYEVTTQ